MGRPCEVVPRCKAKGLVIDAEGLQRLLLCMEAGEQSALLPLLLCGERVEQGRRLGRMGEKGAGSNALRAEMVGSSFDQHRRGYALTREQGCRAVGGEGAGVVVRMAALMGMGEEDLRPLQTQARQKGVCDFGELEAGLLVGKVQRLMRDGLHAGESQGRLQFLLPRVAVPGKAGEAVLAAVLLVARCTVGGVQDVRGSETAKARSKSDYLVIGMGKEEQRPGWYFLGSLGCRSATQQVNLILSCCVFTCSFKAHGW